ERWILARLSQGQRAVEANLDAFDFSHLVQELYHLTFDDFCDWYLEAIKPRLYEGDTDALATAGAALERLLKLLHPAMPHVTEEIWSNLPGRETRLIVAPWPEEFGLGRMRALLTELGEPQRAYPAIHVVGTNGKSTATRRAAAFLAREGLAVGAYTSPHVSGWSERIQVDEEDVDFETAIARVRAAAERIGATQLEILTAAALAASAA